MEHFTARQIESLSASAFMASKDREYYLNAVYMAETYADVEKFARQASVCEAEMIRCAETLEWLLNKGVH